MWWQGKKGEWYVITQGFLFALLAFGPRSSSFAPFWPASLLSVSNPFGFLLLGLGMLVILAGLLRLGPNLSALPHPKDNAELIQKGVYGLVRHPIYSGLILASIGWALLRGSSLMLIYTLILFVFFELKTQREEKQLALHFADYPDYKKRVKKLIPFIY